MAITVTISKTVQVKNYEPLQVTISRTIEGEDTAEDRKRLILETGLLVKKTVELETRRYLESKKEK